MRKSSSSLASIARAGGNVTLDASYISSSSAASIARAAKRSGAIVNVVNSSKYSFSAMASVSRANPGKVFFD